MNLGRVHQWILDPSRFSGGRIETRDLELQNLDKEGRGMGRLWGRYVRVRSAAIVNRPDVINALPHPVPVGDALPNTAGDFLFDHMSGGPRVDKRQVRSPKYLTPYISATHFGEVNTYFHVDRIASYIDELLHQMGAASLPRVVAVVNAHCGAVEVSPGVRDGVPTKSGGWRPFKGGHYRLPAREFGMPEYEMLSPDGEIHLGPGWRLVRHGALAEVRSRYRANASHNAGIIYHEYGHHISRHTADFAVNRSRLPDHQSNRKTELDEAVSDYWAAAMLGTPHIWSWHQRHDEHVVHVRSLASCMTMDDLDESRGADAHSNGTVFAAALWHLRQELVAQTEPARNADLLVLRMLFSLGAMQAQTRRATVELRSDYGAALNCLLHADEDLHNGRHRKLIQGVFGARGIRTSDGEKPKRAVHRTNCVVPNSESDLLELEKLRKHVGIDKVPASEDLLSPSELEARLRINSDPRFTLIAVGDVMLWGRSEKYLRMYGDDYAFAATLPLLQRSHIGLANLEGPMAYTRKADRNFSYRVPPHMAHALHGAGLNVITVANNHLMDCGRQGIVETLSALRRARVTPVGGGLDQSQAHRPAILTAGALRVGFLGYYWNRRTAATDTLPGSAMDTFENLQRDITALRPLVDRLVVTHHWGIPYVREPSPEDREKARLAIDCGADIVIGHHPHIIQPFEEYRSRPIFYSLGNFTFGSGNSKGESLMVAVDFTSSHIRLWTYPVYAKNRDPRVLYQPKILGGKGAARILNLLRSISGDSADLLTIENDLITATLPWTSVGAETRSHG